MRFTVLLFVLFIFNFSGVVAFGKNSSLVELAEKAISNDSNEAEKSIKSLREKEREGLNILFEQYANEINQFSENGKNDEKWKKISYAIDRVAMQKDAYASKLYWFTDFEKAKRAAASENKPLLSLRLLGNLNEEFSCANSRFFRAILYSNSQVSNYLRENYVLHWESVRPAPKVTIDFGNGRKIERTVTGNSIHYILDSDGNLIDGIPGLYNPQTFLKYIKKGRDIQNLTFGLPAEKKNAGIRRYQDSSFKYLDRLRTKTIAEAKIVLREPTSTRARAIAPLAVTKMSTELPILSAIRDDFDRFDPQIQLSDWEKIASVYSSNTEFSEDTLRFIRRQTDKALLTEKQFGEMIENLKRYVSLDTARNEVMFHPRIYSALNTNRLSIELFNRIVYSELFKTPDSDKWLGLYTNDVYTALDGNGLTDK